MVAALAAAVCYGVGTVLQGVAAHRTPMIDAVSARLFARLVGQWPFLLGVTVDLLGFVVSLVALRTLPLYVVEAVVAANLVVTAVLATRVLGTRLAAREWAAVVLVCIGLAALAFSGDTSHPQASSLAAQTLLLVVALVLVAGAAVAAQWRGWWAGPTLGALAGLAFGVVGIAVRMLPDLAIGTLARSPALWALVVAGVGGLLPFAAGIQRAGVTVVTGVLVVTETTAPALVGLLLLGDRVRPGLVPLAVGGFVLAVGGVLALSRFGSLEQPAGARDPGRAPGITPRPRAGGSAPGEPAGPPDDLPVGSG